MTATLHVGDCREVMKNGIEPDSFDAIVTDPPYGLGFMGKDWDTTAGHKSFQAWCEAWAIEAYRVLKPGGYLLAFGGTRTFHRLTCGLEDAGFEIRDCLMYLYGSGFPKSHDVSKAIDKAAGAEREAVGMNRHAAKRTGHGKAGTFDNRGPGLGGLASAEVTAPATDAARQWDGWGTALKPAWEPIIVARKPLIGTVAANVLAHGTGALNIDGCRIEANNRPERIGDYKATENNVYTGRMNDSLMGGSKSVGTTDLGRWPANVVLDEEAAAMLDEQSGESQSGLPRTDRGLGGIWSASKDGIPAGPQYGDTGGSSRFFYTSKASRAEREIGGAASVHPTVKPIDLMRWLCRLVTQPGGRILDPFCGSGSTGIAAAREGFVFTGIDQSAEYIEISRRRITGDAPLFNVVEVIAPD